MNNNKTNNRIVFYRNKENPAGYYLLYSGRYSHNPEEMLQILNHKGEHTHSGYELVNVELAYILETDHAKDFLDFIAKNISSDYIENRFYSGGLFCAWCKLESYEPDQWKKAFDEFKEQKIRGLNKISQPKTQMALF